MHTQVSGTQRISRTLNVISYPKQACKFITTKIFGDELSRTLPHPLNAVNGGKNVNNVFQETKAKYTKFQKPTTKEQLKWESLKKGRRDSRIIMLYKGLKGAASIPTNDLVPPISHVRNHHSLAFQTPFANTDIYKCSFFPQTIRDWNSLTDTLLSAAELGPNIHGILGPNAEGAEDSVAKFTSLVRARD